MQALQPGPVAPHLHVVPGHPLRAAVHGRLARLRPRVQARGGLVGLYHPRRVVHRRHRVCVLLLLRLWSVFLFFFFFFFVVDSLFSRPPPEVPPSLPRYVLDDDKYVPILTRINQTGAAFSTALDLYLAVYPATQLRRLSCSRKKKASLSAMLGLGVL